MTEKVVIDNNPIEKEALKAFEEGRTEDARKLEGEFVKVFREAYPSGGSHCSCEEPCRWHGMCKECVAIHRAHQDHLPNCLKSIKTNEW